MKHKRWENRGFNYTYRVNYLDDVLDIDRFKKRKFTDFKELFKTNRERKAKKLGKDIFTDFLKLLSQDLIENNDIFVFPEKNFGYIKVTNTANSNRKDYRYNIESEGKIFTPRIKLDNRLLKRNKKHYKVRFNQKLRHKMYELITDGHKY